MYGVIKNVLLNVKKTKFQMRIIMPTRGTVYNYLNSVFAIWNIDTYNHIIRKVYECNDCVSGTDLKLILGVK